VDRGVRLVAWSANDGPMGYRGKLAERQQARQLRRIGLPLTEIAIRLGVSKSSVSIWVRDVEFDPLPRPPRGRRRDPNALQRRRQAEIDRLIEEGRLRLDLHQGLDLATAKAFWSALTGIPESQFVKPYRAVADPSIRNAKHVHGCVGVRYSCSATHRSIMGLVGALLGDAVTPG
jgi:transposase